MKKLELQLDKENLKISQLCNWENMNDVQEFRIATKELQIQLESKLTQSIQSHVMGRQRALQLVKNSIPMLKNAQKIQKKSNPQFDKLIEMLEIKDKIDYCLQQLEPIVNK